ncbi:glutamate 5-kinase family protein [Cryptosporidium serpentis]
MTNSLSTSPDIRDMGPQLVRRQRSGPLIVLKVGTSTLTNNRTGKLSVSNIGALVDTVCDLMDKGCRVVLVSSGAVGAGLLHMNIREKPSKLHLKHAIAAIGQPLLMRVYEDFFSMRGAKVAQLLMTRSDFVNKDSYIDFKNTLLDLIHWNVVPIINENDAVTSKTLYFGDNDTLAAYCAIAISADWLILATDVDALYTKNPRLHPDATPVLKVNNIDAIIHMANDNSAENNGSDLGTGGMRTKIIAARVAAAAGISTFLVNGAYPCRLLQLVESEDFIKLSEPVQMTKSLSGSNLAQSAEGEATNKILNEDLYNHITLNSSALATSSIESVATYNADSNFCNDIVTCSPDELHHGQYIGTIFVRQVLMQTMRNQRRWIMSLPVHGRLYLDEGAVKSVVKDLTSLFCAGVKRIDGHFMVGDAVSLISNDDSDEKELARCVTNMDSSVLKEVLGKRTSEVQSMLGNRIQGKVADRANIIITIKRPS